MRIGRTIPPAASPIDIRDIFNGLKGLDTGKLEIERFRSGLKDYFDVKHCYLVSSGKAALTTILEALHNLYPARNEVLIPAFTCFSVPSAIVRAGLKIKLCDVDPCTLDFDFALLRKILPTDKTEISSHISINKKLLAILPAHLFGLTADIDRVRNYINDQEICVIEDAAQAFGATRNGRKIGTLGDVSFLSLGRGKTVSAVEGGIILTDRDDLAERIEAKLLTITDYNFVELVKLILQAIALSVFQNPLLFWFPKSLPFLKVGHTIYNPDFKVRQFTSFQAGLLRNWKNKLISFKKKRSTNSRMFYNFIEKQNGSRQFVADYVNADQISSSNEAFHRKMPPFLRFPVRISNERLAEDIIKESNKKGLGITFTYPGSVNNIDELKSCFEEHSFQNAENLAHQLITFPVHPYISKKDVQKSSKILNKIINQPIF